MVNTIVKGEADDIISLYLVKGYGGVSRQCFVDTQHQEIGVHNILSNNLSRHHLPTQLNGNLQLK